jgi:protein-disulfide isomerase
VKLSLSLFLLFLMVCLPSAAQSVSPSVARKIEHQMRLSYKIPPDVRISIASIFPSSEMPGYDTVIVNVDSGDKQKDYTFLISKDRDTLLRINKFDLSHDAYAQVMQTINVAGRPRRGAQSGKVVVINFDDFECPFCARLHQTLFPQILKEYGDRVTFIYKDDPVTQIHPWAIHAAVDANCLAAQNNDAYWDFADALHASRQEVDAEKTLEARFAAIDKMALQQGQRHNVDAAKLQTCVKAQNDAEVRSSMREAAALAITGTPVLFVNGQRIEGAAPEAQLRIALDTALREAQPPEPESGSPAQQGSH